MSKLGLKEKLREFDHLQTRVRAARVTTSHDALARLLGGEEREGCFVVERSYALDEAHGPVQLAHLLEVTSAALGIAGKDDQLAQMVPRHALFLDTETTGLAGGAGTLAFLLGVGYFTAEHFIVRQYFLRQPQEEAAMLTALQRHMSEVQGLISFNGKSFDVPLLVSRAILNRMRLDFGRLPHFDVLHASRRMWKDRVQDCTLGNLETNILGKSRRADVPSFLIPQIYFDFVRTGKTAQLAEIFAHNREDIVTTAALATYLGQLVQAPFKWQASREELHKIGRLYREAGELETSIALFENLLARAETSHRREDLLALGFCYKSRRRYEDAGRVWERAIAQFAFHPLPFIELAKYLEHRAKDYGRALEVVQRALRALAMLEGLRSSAEMLAHKNDLQRREARLQKLRSKNVIPN
ncbi:MAG: ribonuclease H-like domain-containing protein [candidate division KSB1 bacterium]